MIGFVCCCNTVASPEPAVESENATGWKVPREQMAVLSGTVECVLTRSLVTITSSLPSVAESSGPLKPQSRDSRQNSFKLRYDYPARDTAANGSKQAKETMTVWLQLEAGPGLSCSTVSSLGSVSTSANLVRMTRRHQHEQNKK